MYEDLAVWSLKLRHIVEFKKPMNRATENYIRNSKRIEEMAKGIILQQYPNYKDVHVVYDEK